LINGSFLCCFVLIGSDSSVQQWLAQVEEKLRLTGQQQQPEAQKAVVTVKHDWYQTESQVVVTVLAKNLDPSAVHVHYTSSTVRQTDFTWRIFFVELLN
jgi:hypothetical protein